jgi:signal transduction histidine kinase
MFGLRDPDRRGSSTELPHERLLARQMRTHGSLRFAVAALICIGTLVGDWFVGIEGLRVLELIAVALVIAVVNTGVVYAVRHLSTSGTSDTRATRLALLKLRHVTIVADYLALAVLIQLLGGARSPFMVVFLLHIVLGSVMVSRSAAWIYTAFAISLIAFLIVGELVGLLHPVLPAGAVLDTVPLQPRYVATVLTAYTFLFVATTFLMTQLADSLRRADRGLIYAKSQLELLSDARRDFLHVALHNLKSPIAAVSMILENVRHELAGPLTDKQRELVGRSLARLQESEEFMRDLSKLAELEAADLSSLVETVPVASLLERIIEAHRDLAGARDQQVWVEDVGPVPLAALGSERLLHEAIVNLVTNAIKFTPRGGAIALGAERVGGDVRIWVRDTGPGIPPEKQHKLFLEFARLDTKLPDGERPKGTGLGLSIVKRIAEAHQGSVSVQSVPGTGSTFSLTIPAADPGPTPEDPPSQDGSQPTSKSSTGGDAQVSRSADHDNLPANP